MLRHTTRRLPSLITRPSPILLRPLSTTPPPPQQPQYNPPPLTATIASGITSSTLLLINHGLPNKSLQSINSDLLSKKTETNDVELMVQTWQKMMEVHLSAQVHVLTGLGYPPTEQGIAMYNANLATLMSSCMPEVSNTLATESRDLWRTTLGWTYGITRPEDEVEGKVAGGWDEIEIQEAREIMYDVSARMGSNEFLDKLKVGVEGLTDTKEVHTKIQEMLISHVYFGDMGDSATCLVDKFMGEGKDRVEAYVVLQSLMAKHQSDPLIGQYVGGSMMKVFEAAGINQDQVRSEASRQ